MKNAYLLLAVIGAIVPYIFFAGFFAEHGVDITTFLPALFANGAAGGFSADLLITSATFWLYMFTRKAGPAPWLFIALNLTIGLSCALPAYLYTVTRRAEGSAV
jgi:hypothetical protein